MLLDRNSSIVGVKSTTCGNEGSNCSVHLGRPLTIVETKWNRYGSTYLVIIGQMLKWGRGFADSGPGIRRNRALFRPNLQNKLSLVFDISLGCILDAAVASEVGRDASESRNAPLHRMGQLVKQWQEQVVVLGQVREFGPTFRCISRYRWQLHHCRHRSGPQNPKHS